MTTTLTRSSEATTIAQENFLYQTNPFLRREFPSNPLPRGTFRNRVRSRVNPKSNPIRTVPAGLAVAATSGQRVTCRSQVRASGHTSSRLRRDSARPDATLQCEQTHRGWQNRFAKRSGSALQIARKGQTRASAAHRVCATHPSSSHSICRYCMWVDPSTSSG